MKKLSSQWTQFMQLRKEAWKKNSGLQRVWTRDLAITGAMLYQLSYEATDVGSRSIVGSYVNDIWTAEMKWKWRNDRRSERNLCNWVKRPEKNSGLQRGLNPWPRDYRCDALVTELWSHWRWQLARPFIHSFNFVRRHKFTFVRTWKLCDGGNPPLV